MRDSFFIVLAETIGVIIFAHFLIKKLQVEKIIAQVPNKPFHPAVRIGTSNAISPAIHEHIPNRAFHPDVRPLNSIHASSSVRGDTYTNDMASKLLDYADESIPAPTQSDSGYRTANDLDVITDVPQAVKIPRPNDSHLLNENLNKMSADSVATLPTIDEDVMNGGLMFDNVTGFENNSSNFFDLTQLDESNSAYINLKTA